MPTRWPRTSIREVAVPVERPEAPIIGLAYRQIGVRLWGQGAYEREQIDGGQTRYATLSRVEADDIIVNKIWARNGSVAVVPDALAGGFVSGEFPTFKPLREKLLPRWFHWLTKTRDFWQQCDEKSQGTSGKNRIRPEQFLNVEIPLPPLAEQQRIVGRIEDVARRVEEARGLRREAMGEGAAFISSAVGDLHIDRAWWVRVQDVILPKKGAVRSGPFGSQLHHEEFVDSGVPAIGTRDVQVNRFVLTSGWYVTPEKFRQFSRYQVFARDVLCTIVGASIGRFCIVPDDITQAFTTKHVLALTLDQSLAEPRYVSYMLNYHHECRGSLFAQVEGSAQPSLNAGKVLSTRIPIPTLADQRNIVAYLDGLQAKIDDLRRLQAETQKELEALMPSVLAKAFAGEL